MQYKVLTSLSFCIPGLPSFSWWCRALFWLKVNHWIPSVSDAIFMLCDTQHVAHMALVDLGSNDVKHIYIPESVKFGAPKIRAVELIRDLEKEKRGIYVGSVGHFDYSGDLDTCIAIRTMLFKDGVAYLQAGGGIVHDTGIQLGHYQTNANDNIYEQSSRRRIHPIWTR
ncbi:anthranilate synthase component i [Lichtheimia corymbifera JMRC:FSU:9682]|uniref:Anthranilate synthase component i n=1 Tax=Lichtheimia corymbifera JMRC:FSU:9682 TaxID=1263082 RepID=A0A068RL84_9FUNG|nr:anthranilate synthase component i [Lichtheimia corymbifera JMRC:FSU:9682]